MANSPLLRVSRACLVLSTLAGTVCWSGEAHVVTTEVVTANVATSPAELVHEALHREIYGLARERNQLLRDALRNDPNYGPAHWHQGFVLSNGEWIDIESIVRESESDLLKEYARNRSKTSDTVEGQMSLANWCRDRLLADQERGTFVAGIGIEYRTRHHAERLGFRRVDGKWLSEAEIAATIGRRKLETDATNRSRTELQEIGRDLHHNHAARRDAARSRLAAIKDVHAIPAMESILSVVSQEGALAAVDTIGTFKGQEAVDSLIRHAVLSQWPLVRQAAAERLKDRKLSSFVPQMLNEMYTPLVSRFGITQLHDGRIVYTHNFAREGQEEQQVLRLDTEFNRIKIPDGDLEDSLMRTFQASFTGLAAPTTGRSAKRPPTRV